MERVFGLETEYGITVDGAESVDVVAESIEIVRSYTEHGASMKWDYELEDPHHDARGFRAKELLQDTDESAYYEIDKNRPLSFRGDQERPRAVQRRAFLQRPRPSGIFHAGMHHAARDRGAGQSGRADPGGVRAPAERAACRTGTTSGFTKTTPTSSATATAATTIT